MGSKFRGSSLIGVHLLVQGLADCSSEEHEVRPAAYFVIQEAEKGHDCAVLTVSFGHLFHLSPPLTGQD